MRVNDELWLVEEPSLDAPPDLLTIPEVRDTSLTRITTTSSGYALCSNAPRRYRSPGGERSDLAADAPSGRRRARRRRATSSSRMTPCLSKRLLLVCHRDDLAALQNQPKEVFMLTTWDAVSTLDRMFDDVMGSMLGTATNARTFDPSFDVRSSESEVVFVCDAPGVKQEDLEVTVENHVLTIKGTRKFESKRGRAGDAGPSVRLLYYAYSLPDYLDDANLSANLADGVLTVRIPKHAQAKPRRSPISGGPPAKQLEK